MMLLFLVVVVTVDCEFLELNNYIGGVSQFCTMMFILSVSASSSL